MRLLQLVMAVFIVAVALSGCSRIGVGPTRSDRAGSLFGASAAQPLAANPRPNPVAATSIAKASTDISGFVDPRAAAALSAKERTEAASAQFYALQFGRPGAPRVWQGDSGASGEVQVGPYVRVNQLDCRDFTHKITTAKGEFSKSGTACRETSGGWGVVQS